jgi:lipid II:glycine glycyltransferase (peptidoglycan interpeptide bridge formation enzyme)
VFKDKKYFAKCLKELKGLAKKEKAIFVRVEPTQKAFCQKDIKKMGLIKPAHSTQPEVTLIKNIDISDEEIDKRVVYDVRRTARKLKEAGVKYTVSYDEKDIKYFVEIMQDLFGTKKGVRLQSLKYFNTLAKTLFPKHRAGLLFATMGDEKIATILFFRKKEVFSYVFAASKHQYRKMAVSKGLALYALHFAKSLGCKSFDWWGITMSSDPNHPWRGFTDFKKSFGDGEVVKYMGSWDVPISKLRYKGFCLLRLLNRKLIKVAGLVRIFR